MLNNTHDDLALVYRPVVKAHDVEQGVAHGNRRLMPEEELLLAILEDAIACYQKYYFAQNQQGRRLFQNAEAWIANDSADGLFSFLDVCDVLGIAPELIRRGLLGWKKSVEADRAKKRSLREPKDKAA